MVAQAVAGAVAGAVAAAGGSSPRSPRLALILVVSLLRLYLLVLWQGGQGAGG